MLYTSFLIAAFLASQTDCSRVLAAILTAPLAVTRSQNLKQVLGVYFGLTSTLYWNDLPGALSQFELLQPQARQLPIHPPFPGPHCFLSLKYRLKLVSTLNARGCTKPPAFPPAEE